MRKISLSHDWTFTPQRIGASDFIKQNQPIKVNLPHDFSILQKMDRSSASGPNTGFYPGGTATYEKILTINEDLKGKTLIVEFDGVYMNSTVWVNEQIVAKNPYGYTSFLCDITDYIVEDFENIIKVAVNNEGQPNSRWYSGSGIYRDVWLHVGDKVHIKPHSIFITTPEITSQQARVNIKTEYTLPDGYTHRHTIIDKGKSLCEIQSNKAIEGLFIENPNLWSTENPYLYLLKTELIFEDRVVDSTTTVFGIRTISFDVKEGFKLNGLPMKLKGGCVHHDCGILGSAAYQRAEERKVELLKANGFNAVRCAHNPPSTAFLDACDRLGLLVIDEAFDCWREGKTQYDYNLYFDAFWEQDMRSMILRDRNHPSIIMWSTGNEIVERNGRSGGYETARKLADFVRNLDSSRPVTNALCSFWEDELTRKLISEKVNQWSSIKDTGDFWGDVTREFAKPLDVVGYNYLVERYADDAKRFPDRIIYGSETFPLKAFDFWESTVNNDNVIGDFVWTAIDYLGEAGIGHVWYENEGTFMGPYPWNQAYCGDIDVCGFKRPQSYYRDCLWNQPKTPYIAVYKPEFYGKNPEISLWGWHDVVSSWSWPGFEGKPIKVEVYSIADEVELLLNGNSIGRCKVGKENRYIATFETTYWPGQLKAIAYKDNKILGEYSLRTPKKASKIDLIPDRNVINKEYGDLSYVTIELVDEDSNLVSNSSDMIFVDIEGPGSVVAVGSSNPKTQEGYTNNYRSLFHGKAMVVVRSEGVGGDIILTVRTNNGIVGNCKIKAV